MWIGIVHLKLHLYSPNTLKEKRSIIKSLFSELRRSFNVSTCELDCLNTKRKAEIGIVHISNDKKSGDSILNRLVKRLENIPNIFVEDYKIDFL